MGTPSVPDWRAEAPSCHTYLPVHLNKCRRFLFFYLLQNIVEKTVTFASALPVDPE